MSTRQKICAIGRAAGKPTPRPPSFWARSFSLSAPEGRLGHMRLGTRGIFGMSTP